MVCEQAVGLAGALVAAVEDAVDLNVMEIVCERRQATRSAVSLSALVPPAHSVFLTSAAARIAWTNLQH